MIAAARAGGAVLKHYFGQTLALEHKSGASDFRTIADLESEEAILRCLAKDFPDYNIFSEERDFLDKKSDFTFQVDPLDGSYNYVCGIPMFSVSIGLLEGERIVAGVVYDPMLDRMFTAARGTGAALNGASIHVNTESRVHHASIMHNCGWARAVSRVRSVREVLRELEPKRIFTNWSVALDFCLLASGKVEVIVTDESAVYDFAAGKIIAKEAGARITDFSGAPEHSEKNKSFVATNGTLVHDVLVKALQSFDEGNSQGS